MATIELEKVSKFFKGPRRDERVRVLEDLSLSIADREFFSLVGPSGCGKSTLLNLISGLEELSSGSILFDGRRVDHLPPRERDVAMVFQSYALYPHLTCYENIAFPLRIKKTPAAEIKSGVETVAASLGIENLLARLPRELSGGQRQRIALARALVRRPKVFLLDEPLSNLDAKLRLELRSEFKRIHKEWGITIIYVTHDQEEALSLSDRIAVFNRGRVSQCGTPQELYEKPANTFTAAFIGSPAMNIFSAAHLPGPLQRSGALCGLRPSDIETHSGNSNPNGRAEVSGTVIFTEYTGTTHWVHVQLRPEEPPLRCTAGAGQSAIGDSIRLLFDPQRVHYFDMESGQRLR